MLFLSRYKHNKDNVPDALDMYIVIKLGVSAKITKFRIDLRSRSFLTPQGHPEILFSPPNFFALRINTKVSR